MPIPKHILLTALGALAFAPACASRAAVITSLYGTGLNADGSTAEAYGSDIHYSLVNVPVNDHVSTYLWPSFNNPGRSIYAYGSIGGNIDFQTTFSMAGLDPTTASIIGTFSGGQYGASVYLNGYLVSSSTSFDITSDFLSGLNTLLFVDTNPTNESGSMLFTTSLSGNAAPDDVTVAEPASLAIFAGGLALFVGMIRHLRSKATRQRTAHVGRTASPVHALSAV